jgi:hypothetical protein
MMSDSEDSLLDSAYKKLIDSSNSTVGADLKKKMAPAVMKWPRITHIKVMPDGKKIITHPFLLDDNVFDKLVITHLVVDEPFLAAYGAIAQAWATSAVNMKKDLELDGTNSTPLSFPAINSKTIKTSFDAYMKFAADKKTCVPFNSGCDDEEEPCNIQVAINEMHKKYTSFLETKDSNKQNAASNKKKEMAAAEIIRCASLGMKLSEEEVEECGYGNKKKKARVSAEGTGGTGGTGGSGITSSLQESMNKRSDIMLQKIGIKKHKLELYQQRMALEEKKLNADIKNSEVMHKNSEAMHALLMKLANKMD